MKRFENILSASRHLLLALALLLGLSACVHEFPEAVDAEVILNINYDTELPIYQIVDWVTKSSSDPEDYDTRYVIKAFHCYLHLSFTIICYYCKITLSAPKSARSAPRSISSLLIFFSFKRT